MIYAYIIMHKSCIITIGRSIHLNVTADDLLFVNLRLLRQENHFQHKRTTQTTNLYYQCSGLD